MADLNNTHIDSTGYLQLPTSNRPVTPSNRNIRFNSDRGEVEAYDGTKWENTEEYPVNIPANCLLYLDASNPQSYPGTGTTWYDLSGNGRNATLNNMSFEKTAGGAFATNGSTSYASVGIPDATSAHTCIVWGRSDYRSTGGQSSTDRKTIFKSSGDWNPGLWMTNGMIRPHATGEYRDHYWRSPGWLDYDWHMYGQIWDGTNVYLILDGHIILPTNGRTSYAPGYESTLYIGNEGTSSTTGWLGHVSQAAYFNRVLSAKEISDLYTAQAGRHGRSTLGSYSNPAPHATAILKDNPYAPSTYYWIKPATSSAAYYVYCDMDSDDGGWMLMINARSGNGGQYYNNNAYGQSTVHGISNVVEYNKSTTSMYSRDTINEFMDCPGFKYGRITPGPGVSINSPFTGLYQRIGTGRNKEWGGTNFDCSNRNNIPLIGTNRYDWCIVQYQNWSDATQATNGQTGTYTGGNHYFPTTYDSNYQNFWKGSGDGIRWSSDFRNNNYSSIGQNASPGYFWIKVV